VINSGKYYIFSSIFWTATIKGKEFGGLKKHKKFYLNTRWYPESMVLKVT
jgi:hypothetical protein